MIIQWLLTNSFYKQEEVEIPIWIWKLKNSSH